MPKTYRNLWPQLVSFENLWRAYLAARRGKRARPAVAAYDLDAETRLLRLQERLEDDSYTPGPYRSFVIREWKRRQISAAPFEDRIVHHALCQVIEPIWEARCIHDSYACRVGKGTLAALRLTIHEARAQVAPTAAGFPFLGWVVDPARRRLRRRSVVRFWRRYRARVAAYAAGEISFAQLDATVQGWIGQTQHGSTLGLRRERRCGGVSRRQGDKEMVSCRVSRASCLVSRVACRVSRVACLVSRVACRVSRVSCLVSRVSCLVSRASCRVSRASCLVSRV